MAPPGLPACGLPESKLRALQIRIVAFILRHFSLDQLRGAQRVKERNIHNEKPMTDATISQQKCPRRAATTATPPEPRGPRGYDFSKAQRPRLFKRLSHIGVCIISGH